MGNKEDYLEMEVCASCKSAECEDIRSGDEINTMCKNCGAIEQGYITIYQCQFCGVVCDQKENCHCYGN